MHIYKLQSCHYPCLDGIYVKLKHKNQSYLASNVIYDYGCLGTTVIHWRKTVVTLLSSCIPYFKLNCRIVNSHRLRKKSRLKKETKTFNMFRALILAESNINGCCRLGRHRTIWIDTRLGSLHVWLLAFTTWNFFSSKQQKVCGFRSVTKWKNRWAVG